MALKSCFEFLASRRRVCSLALAIGLTLCPTRGLQAENRFLVPNHLDAIALLGPPPEPGSDEQAADLASARAVFKTRTPEQTARAESDSDLSLFNFAAVIGPEFKADQFPKTGALYAKIKKDLRATINPVKAHWQRPRPCQVDTNLTFGPPESSASYPSGHSMCGTVQALLLAELFTDKREAILAFGRQIGWDRVVIGKHFPTDVRAGRVLGQAIVRELLANPAFQRDLAEARAEVQAVEHHQ